jgi:hypothetical protein
VIGNQVPRLRVAPSYKQTAGTDAGLLGNAYGLKPDPWQQSTLDDWLAETKQGKLLSGVGALMVPRQNGKNAVLEVVELFKMTILGRHILHTAHEVKTARKAFTRLRSFFENEREYPDLARMLKTVRSTNGQEAIILHAADCETMAPGCSCKGGGSVEFVARSRGSARGFTVDDLVCDEVQELTDEQLEALLPTISAAPSGNPQQLYTGTPPGPTASGEVIMRVREQALAGKSKRIAWTEFSIPDDADPDDAVAHWRDNAVQVNPALGIRLSIQTIEDELAGMSPEGFCRERLGRWDRAAGVQQAIPKAKWAATAVSRAPDGVRSFGVAFSADGSKQTIAGAVKASGVIHVEVIAAQSGNTDAGIKSLADWLAERWHTTAQIAISGRAGGSVLYRALRDRGVPEKVIWTASTGEYLESCSLLMDAVQSGNVTHPAADDPQHDVLEQSVAVCVKRQRGGAWGWEAATANGDETPLEAISLAYRAAKMTRRRPGTRQKALV